MRETTDPKATFRELWHMQPENFALIPRQKFLPGPWPWVMAIPAGKPGRSIQWLAQVDRRNPSEEMKPWLKPLVVDRESKSFQGCFGGEGLRPSTISAFLSMARCSGHGQLLHAKFITGMHHWSLPASICRNYQSRRISGFFMKYAGHT